MGVDFYPCKHCGEVYCDAGEYGHCSNCERDFCGSCYDDFMKVYGAIGEGHPRTDWYGEDALSECDYCNLTVIEDDDLLQFALEKFNIDRERLEQEYREKKGKQYE